MQLLFYLVYYHSTCFGRGSRPPSGVIIINQVKQKLHLVGYLIIQYYKDARYHEHKIRIAV